MDLEGFPVQLGPKPEIIRVEQTSTVAEIQSTQSAQLPGASSTAASSQEGNFKIEDFPIFKKEPWLLGGPSQAAQEAGMRQLEKLVRDKDAVGFYNKFERPGYTLNFMDKVYIESTIL